MQTLKNPERLFILLLILLSVSIRLINLDSPLLTGNTFRQTMTAMSVWTFVTEGVSVFGYQTPVFGPPWQIPFEFPIYQLTAAALVKLGIESIDKAGRVAALLYFYLSASFLFLICKRYLHTAASVCILLFYIWSPFTILWSRNFMIDYASVAFSMAYFYCFTLWLNKSTRWPLLLLTIVVGTGAILAKVTTLPIVLVPMAYFAAREVLHRLRGHDYRFNTYVKSDYGFLIQLTLIVLIPLVCFYAWLKYSDAIKASSPFTAVLTSASLSEWNFGNWTQKTSLENWATILQRVLAYLVTFPSAVFLVVGPALCLGSSARGGDFVIAFGFSAFLTIFTFFNLYWVHDYYLMAVSPSISIVVGYCCYLMLTKLLDGDFRLKRWFHFPVLVIPLSLLSTGDYLLWSFQVRHNDPWDHTLNLSKTIRDNTAESDYVIVADVFNWTPQYLYYARRKGFMLWHFEGDESNRFLKAHNFGIVVHAEPHEKLFSNWKHRKLLAVYDKFKVERVSDQPID